MPVITTFPDVSATIRIRNQDYLEQPDWIAEEFPPVDNVPTAAALITVPEGACFGVNLSLRNIPREEPLAIANRAVVVHIYIDGALVISRLLGPDLFIRAGEENGLNILYRGVLSPGSGRESLDSRIMKNFRFRPRSEGGSGEGSIQVLFWHVEKLSNAQAGQKMFNDEYRLRGTGLAPGARVIPHRSSVWKVKRLNNAQPIGRINFRYMCLPPEHLRYENLASASSLSQVPGGPSMPGFFRGMSLDEADGLPKHLSYPMPAPRSPGLDRLSELENEQTDRIHRLSHSRDDVFTYNGNDREWKFKTNAAKGWKNHNQPDKHQRQNWSNTVSGSVLDAHQPFGVKRKAGEDFEDDMIGRPYKLANAAAFS
ncbi:hypothetical protein ACHAQA_007309 [Verticillium albo-atrum]